MMTENCDKYIKKAKYSVLIFLVPIFIGILKKTGILDYFFGSSYDVYFIGTIIIAGIYSLILMMPYINCLSKNKNNLI